MKFMETSAKANVNVADRLGRTGLIRSAFGGHTKSIVALVDAKANVNQADIMGQTGLIWAAKQGHADSILALLNAKANVNAADNHGCMGLIWAVSKQQKVHVVQNLVQAKANIHLKNEDGKTALSIAKERGNEELIKFLKTCIATGKRLVKGKRRRVRKKKRNRKK